ncbi:MAG TPA: DegV family protein [Candidatus Marinimicrobia bacterium]|nr:DegV family protein [Candidatus Neomarinimicrobiota bacterium]HRS51348.1 DegV family protein [Candidatus Neomarinimicrobiota bacterium]HRU91414.1 DegV family protein [Candidatus Neomarinimicrobiota bacterium]
MKIKYIDGKRFIRGIKAGAHKIVDHQDYLNKINVFPVPDADTGTNMAATMKTIVNNIHEDTNQIDEATKNIADSALEGARGNSGVILAQFFYGLAKGIGTNKRLTTTQFGEAVISAKTHAYEALSKPREGTILSVIKDWAENIYENSKKIFDFQELLNRSLEAARRSLENTRTKIEAIRNANVVDSGAQGFVYILEGISHFINRGKLKELEKINMQPVSAIAHTEVLPEQITYRFCTECLIEGKNIPIENLRLQIEPYGDSIVLAGSPQKARLHIHTNESAKVFKIAHQYGDLLQQKADDMLKQYLVAHNPHPQIALVVDSACDLPTEFIERSFIHVIPIRLTFGQSSYLDKVTITPEYFYEMLDTEPEHPRTSQPSPADFINLYSFLLSHYDSIISIHLPTTLSGTYQNALKATQSFPKRKISVIDSKALSVSFGFLAERAVELIAAGKSHNEITDELEKTTRRTQLFVGIPSLKYLMRSGRVSKAKGLIAKLFNIKPILNLDEYGTPQHISKSFSKEGAFAKVLQMASNFAAQKVNPRFAIAHANNLQVAEYFNNELKKRFNVEKINILPVSPMLGAHAGNGAAAIAITWSE